MRIIEKGPLKEYTVNCENCLSKLAYIKSDIKNKIILSPYGETGDIAYLICPVCKEKIIL